MQADEAIAQLEHRHEIVRRSMKRLAAYHIAQIVIWKVTPDGPRAKNWYAGEEVFRRTAFPRIHEVSAKLGEQHCEEEEAIDTLVKTLVEDDINRLIDLNINKVFTLEAFKDGEVIIP